MCPNPWHLKHLSRLRGFDESNEGLGVALVGGLGGSVLGVNLDTPGLGRSRSKVGLPLQRGVAEKLGFRGLPLLLSLRSILDALSISSGMST